MNPLQYRPRLAAAVLATTLWALIAAVRAEAQDCGGIAAQIQHGGVLWTENAVVVQGTAAPNLSDPNLPLSVIKRTAQNAAVLDAYRKAAGILTGVRISSQALAADNPRVVSRIQAFVQNAKVCQAKYYADGGVDMVVMVPLRGAFAVEALAEAGTRVAAGPSAYTGLVVDAAHLAFAPAIAPRILDPDGHPVFDVAMVRKEVVLGGAAVRYAASGKALPDGWGGSRPLRVRAVGLGNVSPSDLLVDLEAARDLSGAPGFLGDGQVVVVIRPQVELDCRGLFDRVTDRQVDWTRRLVAARGRGKVDFSQDQDVSVRLRQMERAAEIDAQRKLLEACLAVRVDGERRLRSLPEVVEKAQGIVSNAVRCDARYFQDGSAEVVLAAPLDAVAALSLDLGIEPPEAARGGDPDPSGLIVDALGLGFQPVLAPSLRSTDGIELYGPSRIARAYFQQQGVAGYHSSLAEALADPRVGPRPLVVKASGPGVAGSLVLAPAEARVLVQAAAAAPFLVQGRVIIVSESVSSPSAPPRGGESSAAAARPTLGPPAASSGQGSGVRVGRIEIP